MKSTISGCVVRENKDCNCSTMLANISFAVPLTMMSTAFERCCLSDCALWLSSKPCRSAIARIAVRAFSDTFGWLLSTRETVPSE